jgi:hypothetical protein
MRRQLTYGDNEKGRNGIKQPLTAILNGVNGAAVLITCHRTRRAWYCAHLPESGAVSF